MFQDFNEDTRELHPLCGRAIEECFCKDDLENEEEVGEEVVDEDI